MILVSATSTVVRTSQYSYCFSCNCSCKRLSGVRHTCTGWRPFLMSPTPSTVLTSHPTTEYTGYRQAFTALTPPSPDDMTTVHAPQPPSPHPSFVPVRPLPAGRTQVHSASYSGRIWHSAMSEMRLHVVRWLWVRSATSGVHDRTRRRLELAIRVTRPVSRDQ